MVPLEIERKNVGVRCVKWVNIYLFNFFFFFFIKKMKKFTSVEKKIETHKIIKRTV